MYNDNEYETMLITSFITTELLQKIDVEDYDTDHYDNQIFLMLATYRPYVVSNEVSEAIAKTLESHTNFQINILTNNFNYHSQCDYSAISDDTYGQENLEIAHAFTVKVPDKVNKKVFNNLIEWARTYRSFNPIEVDKINSHHDPLLELNARCKERINKSSNQKHVKKSFQFFKKKGDEAVISDTILKQRPDAVYNP